MQNQRVVSPHTSYSLIVDGKLYGRFMELLTARKIGEASKKFYQIYQKDTLIEELS